MQFSVTTVMSAHVTHVTDETERTDYKPYIYFCFFSLKTIPHVYFDLQKILSFLIHME